MTRQRFSQVADRPSVAEAGLTLINGWQCFSMAWVMQIPPFAASAMGEPVSSQTVRGRPTRVAE